MAFVMAFSPPEYCRLFAQKKAHQEGGGGVTGTPGPPLVTPLPLKLPFHLSLSCLRGAELKINVTDPKGSGAYLSFTNQFYHLIHWSLFVVLKVCAL